MFFDYSQNDATTVSFNKKKSVKKIKFSIFIFYLYHFSVMIFMYQNTFDFINVFWSTFIEII